MGTNSSTVRVNWTGGGFLCAFVFHWTTLKRCSHFPFNASLTSGISLFLVDTSISQGSLCTCKETKCSCSEFKVLAMEKSTKAVCSFTYCKVMVITTENCGEGSEMCEREVWVGSGE